MRKTDFRLEGEKDILCIQDVQVKAISLTKKIKARKRMRTVE
jgi:hypothetical protein